jgi:hypothetical protein
MRPKIFICTRFNIVLRTETERSDKTGSPTGTLDWLERRFELFERICLPSLMAQTDPDFYWFVFFSDRTPEPFLTRIHDLHKRFPTFMPRFLVDGEIQVRRFRAEVQKQLTPEDTHVITTRLDNDDAIHRTYVERLRAEFRGQDDEIVNFLNGIQYDIEGGVMVDLKKQSNPFIGRIERVREGQVGTVLHWTHDQILGNANVRNVETIPLWLQLIHRGNLINNLASFNIRLDLDLEKEFGIPEPAHINKLRSMRMALVHWLFVAPRRKAGRVVARLRS